MPGSDQFAFCSSEKLSNTLGLKTAFITCLDRWMLFQRVVSFPMSKNTNVYSKFLDDEYVVAIYHVLSTVVNEGGLSS